MTIENAYAEGVEISAPVEKVFDYRLDFMNLPKYMDQAKKVRRVDGGTEPGPGAEYNFDLTIPEMGQMVAYIRILDMERPNWIKFETGSAGMGGTEISTFKALSSGGTHVEFAFRMELPDEAKEGLPALEASGRASFRNELEGLKRLMESG